MMKGKKCMNDGGAYNDGGPMEAMKKGGRTKHASGGRYEGEMVGERTSKSRPSINYEKDLNGQPKVKGYAIGGPGKMRKGEMSKSGKPVSKKAR